MSDTISEGTHTSHHRGHSVRRQHGRRADDLTGAVQLDLARSLVDLQRLIDPNLRIDETLNQLASGIQSLTGASTCVAVLDDASKLSFAAATDERIKTLGELQITQEEGPLWQAFTENDCLERLDVSSASKRWPDLMAIAELLGFTTVSALSIWGDDESVGVVFIAADRCDQDEHRYTLLKLLIAGAGIALANRRSFGAATKLVDQLQRALDSRILIEQAKGFVHAQTSCTVDEAFTALRSFARSNNRKLNDVAQEVLDRDLSLEKLLDRP